MEMMMIRRVEQIRVVDFRWIGSAGWDDSNDMGSIVVP